MDLCNQFINLAQRQVGYKEDTSKGANWTKYSRWFDTTAWQWFNTKKQNSEWCAIFICWLFAQNEILGKDKALKFLGCPAPKNNCAAGCGYLYDYMKAKGYQSSIDKAKAGDIIFFKNGSKCSHVGMIEKVDKTYLYTIEGNVSNMVKRCKRKRSAKTTIFGIMSPDWKAAEKLLGKTEEKTSAPASDVVTTPAAPVTSSKPVYIVNTKTDPLMLRAAAYGSAPIIARMKKGSEVTYLGTTTAGWMKVKYKTMVGWAWKDYLKKK